MSDFLGGIAVTAVVVAAFIAGIWHARDEDRRHGR